jgi:hypothetical protein
LLISGIYLLISEFRRIFKSIGLGPGNVINLFLKEVFNGITNVAICFLKEGRMLKHELFITCSGLISDSKDRSDRKEPL